MMPERPLTQSHSGSKLNANCKSSSSFIGSIMISFPPCFSSRQVPVPCASNHVVTAGSSLDF